MKYFVLLTLFPFIVMASTGHKSIIWNKKELKVCWLDNLPVSNNYFSESQLKEIEGLGEFTSLDENNKSIISSSVQSEYTKEQTGIHFTGWKTCQADDLSDVVILIGSKGEVGITSQGQASLGRADSEDIGKIRETDKKAFVFIDVGMWETDTQWSREDYIKFITLHEFGHIAGLRHEHIRVIEGEKWNDSLFFSKYDSHSVMNYIFMGELEENGLVITDGKRIGLSPLDVHGLRCLYLYDEETFNNICHANFKH